LPTSIVLEGRQQSGGNQLSWTVPVASGISSFELQRTGDVNAVYQPIGHIPARVSQADDNYSFVDNVPGQGNNLYRLHILYNGGGESYTNVVSLGGDGGPLVSAYPVDKLLNIRIQGESSHNYTVALYNVVGQPIFNRLVNGSAGILQYHRDGAVPKGIYILKVLNTTTGANNTYKIQFK
jgi:hypothetical protein